MSGNIEKDLLKVKVGKEPDEQQKKVIRKTDNAVVSAGAGSGKTEVLATRFVYLLMTDSTLHVKNILAITFTKKAASEIYARVFLKLNQYKRALSLPENAGFEKELANVERALKEFSDARIQTLDSYSNDIVKLAASRYGIRPDFQIGGSSTDIEKKALSFVLLLKDDENYRNAFESFCALGNMEAFAKDYLADPVIKYTTVATKDGWFSENLMKQYSEIVSVFNECNALYSQLWLDFKNAFSQLPEASDLKDSGKKLRQQAEELIRDCSENPFSSQLVDASNINMEVLRFQKDVVSRFGSFTYSAEKAMKELWKIVGNFKIPKDNTPQSLAVKFHACSDFILSFKARVELCQMLDIFLSRTNVEKKINGLLTFKDIADLSLLVLEEQNDIRDQQKKNIRKIMIDEFQDNNAKNRDMLFLISEEDGRSAKTQDYENARSFYEDLKNHISLDKLFFVGDEKQSIYKFRGADVSVFNELKSSLRDKEGNVLLDMNNNYRSDIELLKAFNGMFGDDKTKEPTHPFDIPSLFWFDKNSYATDENGNDMVPSYEAKYLYKYKDRNGNEKSNYAEKNPVTCNNQTVHEPMKKCLVHACILNDGVNSDETKFSDYVKEKKILDANETLAFFIAKKIYELHTGEEKIPLGDFAVLDNSRTHRNKIQKYLDAFGLSYKVDVQKGIFREAVVNDFYNFLRICIYPDDTNAFASFLASPFAGLSIEGVEAIMAHEDPANLSESDRLRYETALNLRDQYKMKILASPITRTIEDLWYQMGYFYQLKKKENLAIYEEQFDLLYQIAFTAENEGRNISWFVDQLAIVKSQEYKAKSDEEAEIETEDVHYPLERQEAVTIMTIHQSKGLQFKYVFITGIFENPRPESSSQVFFDEENTGVSFRTLSGEDNYFQLKQTELSRAKELAEQKRKIYVAVTRAEKEVFLVGALSENQNLKPATKKTGDVSWNLSAKPSLMHKLIRYYYNIENGLYQDNDYSEKGLNPDLWNCVPYYNESGNAPFDFFRINPVAASASRKDFSNNKQEQFKYIENRKCLFENEKALESSENYAVFQDTNSSPSGLEKIDQTSDTKELPLAKITSTWQKNPAYDNLNSIVPVGNLYNEASDDDVAEESAAFLQFTRGTFGTMAHSYMEYWVKSGNFEGVEQSECFDGNVARLLYECFDSRKEEMKHQELSKICSTMAEEFSKSFLGQEVTKARENGRILKAEYGFKMLEDDVHFTGSIDLFYVAEDGTYTIVDYKTDDNTIGLHPERYFAQQACYRLALSRIYGIPFEKIRVWLYFLRFDHELEITDFCGKDVLESAISDIRTGRV